MQWPIRNQLRDVPIAPNGPHHHGPYDVHRPLHVPWRAVLVSKKARPYDNWRDYVDLVDQMNAFTVQASKAALLDRARKFYVYIDLHESAEQCD